MRQAIRNIIALTGLLLIDCILCLDANGYRNRNPLGLRMAQPFLQPPGPFAVVVLILAWRAGFRRNLRRRTRKRFDPDVAHRIDRLLEAEGIATVIDTAWATLMYPRRSGSIRQSRERLHFCQHPFNEDNQPVSSGGNLYAAHQ